MEFLVARGEWIGLESIDGTLHGGVRSGIMATNYAPLSFGERPKGYLEDHRMKNNQKWYTQCFVNSVPTGTTLAGDMTPRERESSISLRHRREELGVTIDESRCTGKRTIVTRTGKRVAATVPVSDLERLEELASFLCWSLRRLM
ncbi:hypothetical protein Cst04h_24530 [Corynebacterium striatum]|uniref:Antitoxin n=1 Tax=Corynebacterium striatum TaxID=43770 RepID=A0ABC9ZQQ2_CORST|nr:hypothetical protein Cst04h_24530 [Corynebacterium striatum]